MQFLLMIHADESAVESAGNDEVVRTLREYAAFRRPRTRRGVVVGGALPACGARHRGSASGLAIVTVA